MLEATWQTCARAEDVLEVLCIAQGAGDHQPSSTCLPWQQEPAWCISLPGVTSNATKTHSVWLFIQISPSAPHVGSYWGTPGFVLPMSTGLCPAHPNFYLLSPAWPCLRGGARRPPCHSCAGARRSTSPPAGDKSATFISARKIKLWLFYGT